MTLAPCCPHSSSVSAFTRMIEVVLGDRAWRRSTLAAAPRREKSGKAAGDKNTGQRCAAAPAPPCWRLLALDLPGVHPGYEMPLTLPGGFPAPAVAAARTGCRPPRPAGRSG